MGLKFGSTFGTLQVGAASRVGLHVSRTTLIDAEKVSNARAAVAAMLSGSSVLVAA